MRVPRTMGLPTRMAESRTKRSSISCWFIKDAPLSLPADRTLSGRSLEPLGRHVYGLANLNHAAPTFAGSDRLQGFDTKLLGAAVEPVQDLAMQRDAVGAPLEHSLVLDQTGIDDPIVARRRRRRHQGSQHLVHRRLELVEVDERRDVVRG